MAVAMLHVLRGVAAIAALGRAAALGAERPAGVAREAHGAVAGGAAVRAAHALAPLLVRVVAVGTRAQARAGQREVRGPAADALGLARAVARLARRVARAAPVVLGFVGELRASGVATVAV